MALRITTFLLVASLHNMNAEMHGRITTQAPYRGFTFAPVDCPRGTADCALRMPKEWTAAEMDLVRRAIDEIVDKPTGTGIVRRTQASGVSMLRRYSVALTGNSVPVPAISAALRRQPPFVGIDVNDRFFANGSSRDRFSGTPGYLLVAQTLLHECMHAVDQWSAKAEFLSLIGFVTIGERWRFDVKTPDEVTALVRFDKDLASFEKSEDWEAQWRINRTLALGMRPVRVPTMQSIRSPAEAFAEIGSHLILDPTARKYLASDLVAYFDANVFVDRPPRYPGGRMPRTPSETR